MRGLLMEILDCLLNIVKEFKIKKTKKTGDLSISIRNYIYQNKLDKAYFAHDAEYADSKNLAKGTVSYKTLKERSGTRN